MKQGVALLWSLLLTAVLLIVSGSMATVIIRESRMVLNIVDSSQSYANAKSGADWAEAHIATMPTITSSGDTFNFDFGLSGDATTKITNLGSGSYLIESTGHDRSGNIARKIERKITPSLSPTDYVSLGTNPPGSVSVGNNNGSFTLTFDFWMETGAGNDVSLIGLDDTLVNNAIGLKITTNNPSLLIKSAGTTTEYPIPGVTLSSKTGDNQYFSYRAKIRYTEDTGIVATIYEADNDFNYNCIGYISKGVTGLNFGDLNTIGAIRINNPAPTFVTSGTIYDTIGKHLDLGNISVAKFLITGRYSF